MIEARDMDQFQKAHEELQGILFVNTIATSSDGRAWYADVSAAPNLSEATVAAWRERLAGDAAARDLYGKRGMILLDGSTSRDEWVADERARDAGVAPYAAVPKIERRDYVFNANDSFWTPHAQERLEGFSPAHGPERAVRSLRTRQNMTTLSDVSPTGPAGEDGKWINTYSFRSRHPQGANFAMVDGSVRFVKQSIPIATYRAFSTATGNESVTDD